jgi:hypothetical protein
MYLAFAHKPTPVIAGQARNDRGGFVRNDKVDKQYINAERRFAKL